MGTRGCADAEGSPSFSIGPRRRIWAGSSSGRQRADVSPSDLLYACTTFSFICRIDGERMLGAGVGLLENHSCVLVMPLASGHREDWGSWKADRAMNGIETAALVEHRLHESKRTARVYWHLALLLPE